VLDPAVLDTLAAVPREQFVPAAYRSLAFADTAIPLPCGQRMLTPQVEGRLLQALAVRAGERVLQIGTGSGFVAACLAHLGGPVTSLELHRELADHARDRLRAAGARVEVVTANAFSFAPAERFDVVAVTGAVASDYGRFADWLAPGGRLFVVAGREPVMEARLIRRHGDNAGGGELITTSLFETVIPALESAPETREFVF
jgi:protein-L-isoaspartate(D-aspartate) O-methyltransferase